MILCFDKVTEIGIRKKKKEEEKIQYGGRNNKK